MLEIFHSKIRGEVPEGDTVTPAPSVCFAPGWTSEEDNHLPCFYPERKMGHRPKVWPSINAELAKLWMRPEQESGKSESCFLDGEEHVHTWTRAVSILVLSAGEARTRWTGPVRTKRTPWNLYRPLFSSFLLQSDLGWLKEEEMRMEKSGFTTCMSWPCRTSLRLQLNSLQQTTDRHLKSDSQLSLTKYMSPHKQAQSVITSPF